MIQRSGVALHRLALQSAARGIWLFPTLRAGGATRSAAGGACWRWCGGGHVALRATVVFPAAGGGAGLLVS